MRKKIFVIITMFFFSLVGIKSVNAKIITPDEVPNSTYIIGKYMFTRTPNANYSYNGELTTQEIMLAAKSIENNDLNNMKIYYKKINGDWIDGLTGESVSIPWTFDIENRNLREILQTPQLQCSFLTESPVNFASCYVGIYEDGELLYGSNGSINPSSKNYGIEYYVLKDSDGNLLTDNVVRSNNGFAFNDSNGIIYSLFRTNDPLKIAIPTSTDFSGGYDNNNFYQIMARIYYMDGEEKVYSDYSNVESNGVYNKLSLNSHIGFNAKFIEPEMHINSSNSLNVTYHNIEFNLSGVDTSKYRVRQYEVYARENTNYYYEYNLNNIDGSTSTNKMLYYNIQNSELYQTPHFKVVEIMLGDKNIGSYYLTSVVQCNNPYTCDVSSEKGYSIRFDKIDDGAPSLGKNMYYAKVELCEKDSAYNCYEYNTNITSASVN